MSNRSTRHIQVKVAENGYIITPLGYWHLESCIAEVYIAKDVEEAKKIMRKLQRDELNQMVSFMEDPYE